MHPIGPQVQATMGLESGESRAVKRGPCPLGSGWCYLLAEAWLGALCRLHAGLLSVADVLVPWAGSPCALSTWLGRELGWQVEGACLWVFFF